MWTKSQVTQFARDMDRGDAGRIWSFVDARIRAALIDAKVMEIVLGQDRTTIDIDAIRGLRESIELRLRDKPFGLWVEDDDRPHRRKDGTVLGACL